MKKNIPINSEIALNPNYLIWILGFAITLWGNIYLFLEENIVPWILVLFLVLFIFLLIFDEEKNSFVFKFKVVSENGKIYSKV